MTGTETDDVTTSLTVLRERLFGLEVRANTLGDQQAIRGDDAQTVWVDVERGVAALVEARLASQRAAIVRDLRTLGPEWDRVVAARLADRIERGPLTS